MRARTYPHTHTHNTHIFLACCLFPFMTRCRHVTFLTTQTNSSLTETVEHWSSSLKMNEFNAWPVCEEHSLPKWFAGRISGCWFRQIGFVACHQSSVVGCGVTGIIPVSRATFPCSANSSRTVLDQTSSCCRLMSLCCSFALTNKMNKDYFYCLERNTGGVERKRTSADLDLSNLRKETKARRADLPLSVLGCLQFKIIKRSDGWIGGYMKCLRKKCCTIPRK